MCLLLVPAQVLANIGKVIGVKPGAEITRGGKSQPLQAGMDVASGDSISTDGNGLVQLVFVDETKIAIGPNASMVLDVTMLRGNRKAKSFAVQALGGSFRFISGKSKKRVYSIKTPTATMAVRGTTFDMWVIPGAQSAMLVLEGTVHMCGNGGFCHSAGRQCSLFATNQRGGVGRPVDQAQYDLALQTGFPFIQSQQDLLSPLQVGIGGCAGEAAPLPMPKSDPPQPPQFVQESTPQPVVLPEPPAPEPPAPDPEPDPEPEPEPEPDVKGNRSGQADGSNPGGQSGNTDGFDNPGKAKGKGKGRGKGKRA
ncbi:FecR family protein [Ruegeria lacuscaerulensis]|uniref:FecR family protein n=1 Tax=Ruegeria lacuscaerulensis TaxID=55218 RepID=UPI0014798E7E|nr:FecR domain-containing protein [Ruegeria lacuscaerulensis]